MSRRTEPGGRGVAAIIAAALLTTAGSAQAASSTAEPRDPLEGLNRGLYAIHRVIDKVVLHPAMVVYVTVLPEPLRQGLGNAAANLTEPVTVVNDVLQLRFTKAMTATTRFATNSTAGVFGLFDVAGKNGIEGHTADFGQTLGRYGVPAGPYIFIPGLGPSTLRDAGGRVVDTLSDPVRMVQFDGDNTLNISRAVVGALDARAYFDNDLKELDRSATDPYVTLRSAYLQNRQTFIDGDDVNVQALPSFEPEPAAGLTPAPAAPEPAPRTGQ